MTNDEIREVLTRIECEAKHYCDRRRFHATTAIRDRLAAADKLAEIASDSYYIDTDVWRAAKAYRAACGAADANAES